jgi:hypothetical protein
MSNEPEQPTVACTNLVEWFPHLTKLSDLELGFLLQSFAELIQAARKAGALLADDFLSRWLLILEALMRDKGYPTVNHLRAALAAKVPPTAKPTDNGVVN